MGSYAYHRPRSLEEALSLRQAAPAARLIAGGTDLMLRLRHGLRPPALISLGGIDELRGIEVGPAGARLGALTTFAEVLAHRGLGERYPLLAQVARVMGSSQVRNLATLGGNLANASPCADSAPALLALEARVRVRGTGATREIALSDFFRGPGDCALGADEILTDVLLDPPAPAARAIFRKTGRVRMDLALASVAVLASVEDRVCRLVRVAAGSVAPVPLRLREVEARLTATRLTPTVLREVERLAAAGVAPITDLRATEAHRRHLVGVHLRRALEELAGLPFTPSDS